jgi:hypothetical protein
MKFQSAPGRVVQKRVKRGGRRKIVALFKFDKDGYATIDESKYTATDILKLKRLFKVVEEDYSTLKYQDLQKIYAEKTGKSAVGVKKADMLKEL